jgi:hypothetical protein
MGAMYQRTIDWLAARVRLLSSGHGRKNDDADAISVGIRTGPHPRRPLRRPN